MEMIIELTFLYINEDGAIHLSKILTWLKKWNIIKHKNLLSKFVKNYKVWWYRNWKKKIHRYKNHIFSDVDIAEKRVR